MGGHGVPCSCRRVLVDDSVPRPDLSRIGSRSPLNEQMVLGSQSMRLAGPCQGVFLLDGDFYHRPTFIVKTNRHGQFRWTRAILRRTRCASV